METFMRQTSFRILATLALLSFPLTSAHAADTYTFDPNHTTVIWSAEHLGFSHPHGLFSNVEGTLTLDEAAPANSKVDVTIKTAGIATGIAKFDDHLKSKDFFDVEKHPTATFKSTKVEKTGDATAKVTGDLTLLGVTKPVTLDVTLNKKGEHPMSKKPTVGLSAKGTIKRSEFGLSFGVPNVGDDVPIVIEAEASL
jgi:polyisoprenoid-binding protein YceI